MSQLLPASAFRNFGVGIVVHRAATTVAADADLFSIDGGPILLTGFLGHVTVAIGGGSQDFENDFDPDDGGSVTALSTILLVDGDVTGTFYTLNTSFGGVLIETLDHALNASLEIPIALPTGDITLDVTGTEAGEVEWWATYVPLSEVSTLTAV